MPLLVLLWVFIAHFLPSVALAIIGRVAELGVHNLVPSCLNDACRHQGLIDVSKYPDNVEVPSFAWQSLFAPRVPTTR